MAARLHTDESVSAGHKTGGTARCGIVPAAHADPAVDGEGGALCHGQGSVGNPVAASAVQGYGRVRIKGFRAVEWNEQDNAIGYGIAAAQGTVAYQCHLCDAVGGGVGGGVVKVFINLRVNFKHSHAHLRELGRNCGVILHVQGG